MVLDRSYMLAAISVAGLAWGLTLFYFPILTWIVIAFIAGTTCALALLLYFVLTTSRGVEAYNSDRLVSIAQLASTKTEARWLEEREILNSRSEYRRPTIFPQVERFSKALDGLLDLLLQEHITTWYRSISPRPLFQNEVDRAIRSSVLTLVARVAGRDLVVEGISRLLPTVTSHLGEFYEAERAIRGKKLDYTVTEGDELDIAIAGRYRGGRLHTAALLENADTRTTQQEHIRDRVSKLLPLVLPANMTSSKVVIVIVREIVTCAVLVPLLELFEDPDFWNQMIITIAGPMLRDRKSVRKVRAALDQHAPASPKTNRITAIPKLRPYDNERQFEKFIRAIRQLNTISDARRCRSDLVGQLRRDSILEGQDPVYLRRLETGQRLLDQKISALTADKADNTFLNDRSRKQTSLRETLADAAGLSYFMEYMDRLKLMQNVQFWLVVDGFRGPLEGDHDEILPQMSNGTDKMDIKQMYEAYLVKSEVQASDDTLRLVKQYISAGKGATPQQYLHARRAVLQTQTAVFERMKVHFDTFKRSDLFYKWIATDSAASPRNASPPASPTPPARSSSANRRPNILHKDTELRRAVLSSADLKGIKSDGRRSLDSARPPLFDDEQFEESMSASISSLHSNDADGNDIQAAQEEAKAMSAMQLALDNIVGEDGDTQSTAEQRRLTPNPDAQISRQFSDRPHLTSGVSSSGTPVNAEASRLAENEHHDSDDIDYSENEGVEEAAPGDLGLAEAIGALNTDIERLNGQKHILDSLKAKAKLTNNKAELRILKKSEQSLLREIRRKEMQKQQWTVQESDNSLYGRAQIHIKSVMVGRESDGKEYALYVIEVRRQAGENMTGVTWAVTRRYSQFHELHKRLRARFPIVRSIDFPRRQALFTLQKDFLERRRTTLEQYLGSLLLVPAICRSRELRAFLSQSSIISSNSETNPAQADAKDFVSRIYNSVSDGMEELLGNIPVLDSLSVAGQNLITAAASQSSADIVHAIDALDPTTHDPATAAEAEAELNAYETKEDEPFVKPICDLFLETFELSKGNSWLRGRTVVIVLHQLLGGTIERKVREGADSALQDDSLVGYINMLRQIMWPEGKVKPPTQPRTAAEKMRAQKEAALLLDSLLPDLAGSVVGRTKARAAGRKIVAMLNNRRLKYALFFLQLIQ